MKLKLLLVFTLAALLQSGCATHPSIEEQDRHEQQAEQAAKKSDVFAKALPQ